MPGSNRAAPENFAGLGFAPGSVRGARTFTVADGWLYGVIYHQLWTPDVNVAICRYHEHRGDDFPVRPPHQITECKHGFYAFNDGSNDYHSSGKVFGVIEGFGEVLIGTRGFRCMKARIVALTFQERTHIDVVSKVQINYPNIPFFTSFEEMVAEYPPYKEHSDD